MIILPQRFWLAIGLLAFAAAHVCGASMLAAASGTHNTAIVFTQNGD
jgi:hypothetical protein